MLAQDYLQEVRVGSAKFPWLELEKFSPAISILSSAQLTSIKVMKLHFSYNVNFCKI